MEKSKIAIIDLLIQPIDADGALCKEFTDFWTSVFTESWINTSDEGNFVGIRSEIKLDVVKDSYILTPEKLQNAKHDLCIMHPLPRVNEIAAAVDSDPRACYFKQVLYGKFIRMALILMLLEVEA